VLLVVVAAMRGGVVGYTSRCSWDRHGHAQGRIWYWVLAEHRQWKFQGFQGSWRMRVMRGVQHKRHEGEMLYQGRWLQYKRQQTQQQQQ
jgi:hypothetical protein